MASQTDYIAADELLTELELKISKRHHLFIGVTVLIILLAIVFILVKAVFQINIVRGDSMNNTLENGDIAVSLRHCVTLSAGDIVILQNTVENDYIKRVVAVPGDMVDIDEKNGALLINGKTADEPYACGKTEKTNAAVAFPITLGKNEYFVLGDNREHSSDSRYFGAISINRIGGVVILPDTN